MATRSVLGRRAEAWLVASVVLVSCGSVPTSDERPTEDGAAPPEQMERRAVAATVDPATGRLAVADDGTVLAVDRDGEGRLRGVAITPRDGATITPEETLPVLRNAWPVALEDGFAIGGLRCLVEPPDDEFVYEDEGTCTAESSDELVEAEVYVVFLETDGTIRAEVGGPTGLPTGGFFWGASDDSVFTSFGWSDDSTFGVGGFHRFYRATTEGFSEVDAPPNAASICALPDGTLLSVVLAGSTESGNPTSMRVETQRASWEPLTEDLEPGGGGVNCVPGGLVGSGGLMGEDMVWRASHQKGRSLSGATVLAIGTDSDVVTWDGSERTVRFVDWLTGTDIAAARDDAQLAAVSPNRRLLAVVSGGRVEVSDVALR